VKTSAWREVAETLREKLGYDYFCFLSAIDWMPSPYGRG
jgi:NADH-quinone oxidoreductase subunit C